MRGSVGGQLSQRTKRINKGDARLCKAGRAMEKKNVHSQKTKKENITREIWGLLMMEFAVAMMCSKDGDEGS